MSEKDITYHKEYDGWWGRERLLKLSHRLLGRKCIPMWVLYTELDVSPSNLVMAGFALTDRGSQANRQPRPLGLPGMHSQLCVSFMSILYQQIVGVLGYFVVRSGFIYFYYSCCLGFVLFQVILICNSTWFFFLLWTTVGRGLLSCKRHGININK